MQLTLFRIFIIITLACTTLAGFMSDGLIGALAALMLTVLLLIVGDLAFRIRLRYSGVPAYTTVLILAVTLAVTGIYFFWVLFIRF